jgi:hypothetical protein
MITTGYETPSCPKSLTELEAVLSNYYSNNQILQELIGILSTVVDKLRPAPVTKECGEGGLVEASEGLLGRLKEANKYSSDLLERLNIRINYLTQII